MSDQPGLTPPSDPYERYAPPGEATPEPPLGTPGATPDPAPHQAAYSVPPQFLAPTGTETHQGALWSMILGILGLVCAALALVTSGVTAIGMVCSPVAFGLGLWASRDIGRRPDRYGNRGMAIAGWVMGLVGILLAVVTLLLLAALIAFFIYVLGSMEAA